MKQSTIISALLLATILQSAAIAATNISSTSKYAWSETSGWLNFSPTNSGVTVYADHLEGFAWSESIGWIKLGSHSGGGSFAYGNTSASDWGVNRSGTALSGYAWSETSGWINFAPTGGGVTLNEQSGIMTGLAWGESVGWIKLRNSSPAYGVQFLPTFGVSVILFDGVKGYAAQDGGGIWKSGDNGATWTAAASQPANQRIKALAIDRNDTSKLYVASYGSGIYTSTNSGDSWSACSGQPGNLNALALAIDPTGNLYAGTEGGIYTSTDCSSWSSVNSGLTVDAATPPVAILIDAAASTTIYTGLDGGGIYNSTNGGTGWSAATTQPANMRVKALAQSSGVLYAASYGGGVFTSSDSGATWAVCANTGLTNLNLVSLTGDAGGRLYAGTEAGVFVSTDGCGTWTGINGGLP